MYDFLSVCQGQLSCTVFELSDVEEYRDFKIWVRETQATPFDRSHTSSCSSSILTMVISYIVLTFPK